jgi:hypothetical protein
MDNPTEYDHTWSFRLSIDPFYHDRVTGLERFSVFVPDLWQAHIIKNVRVYFWLDQVPV